MKYLIAGTYVQDLCAHSQLTQEHGAVYIVDMEGFGITLFKAFTINALKMMGESMDVVPVWTKGIHFVNNGPVISFALKALKSIMKLKVFQRIHVHGNDMSSLHEHFSPVILPTEYGGEMEGNSWMMERYAERILELEEYYIELGY